MSTGLAAMEQVRLSTCKAQSEAVGGARPGSPPSPAAPLARRLGCQTIGLALLPEGQELIPVPLLGANILQLTG